MKTRRNRQRGSGFFSRLFKRQNTTPPVVSSSPSSQSSSSPSSQSPSKNTLSANALMQTHKNMTSRANKATKAQGRVSAATSVGEVLGLGTSAFAGIAAGMALAGKGALLGAAAGFPPLLAALMGTYLACLFVARQRNINRELMANLYIIKMEIERMKRVYAVIEVIAKERGIDLNTVALRGIIDGLGKKIMIFAGKDTRTAIENVEKFLSEGNTKAVLEELEKAEKDLNNAAVNGVPNLSSKGGYIPLTQDGGWSFASWKARWLSPGETLRIIVRDVTIANIWFSIMLAEYNVFKEYTDLMRPNYAHKWVESSEMKTLINANKQLRNMTRSGIPNNNKNDNYYDLFYQILNKPEEFTKYFKIAVSGYNKRFETANAMEKEGQSGEVIQKTERSSSDPEAPLGEPGAPPGVQLEVQGAPGAPPGE